jgi:peptidoglycan/LPS O-acetylase OafA/YrhL
MYFYLCFAFMLALTRVLALPSLLGLWAVAVLCLHGVLRLCDIESPIAAVIAHPLTLEFIFGAVVGILIQRNIMGHATSALIAGVIAFIVVLSFRETATAFIVDRSWMRVVLVGGPCALIVYGAVAQERQGALKASWWLVELGDASYSTYLSHVLVLSALGRLFAMIPDHNAIKEVGFVIACLVGANVVGMASYRLIERRGRWGRPAKPSSDPLRASAVYSLGPPAPSAEWPALGQRKHLVPDAIGRDGQQVEAADRKVEI